MKTHILIILDKSGSMQSVVNDTIGGFNTWLKNQKKVAGEQFLTLTLFDTKIETRHKAAGISDISSYPTLTLLYPTFF